MGYKAWVGGKSAWVSTDFGTKREAKQHETSSDINTYYEHGNYDEWTISLKNGSTLTIFATSYEAAVRRRDHMASADKKKKPIKNTLV